MKSKFTTGLVAAILLTVGLATSAFSQNTAAPDRGRNVTTTNLLITSEFIKVPDSEISGLDIPWKPAAAGNESAILTQAQHTNIVSLLKRNRNVSSLSAPRIAFAPPKAGETRQGSMSVTKTVLVAGTNAQAGINLDVTATLLSDSDTVNLNLTGRSSELTDTPQPDLRTTTAKIDAALKLNPRQTVVVRQPTAEDSKSLLIFVTPQLERMTERLQRVIKKHPPSSN